MRGSREDQERDVKIAALEARVAAVEAILSNCAPQKAAPAAPPPAPDPNPAPHTIIDATEDDGLVKEGNA